MTMLFRDERLPERFWAKVQVAPSGCWLWTGCKNRGGYGMLNYRFPKQTTVVAHKVAYQALSGPVPAGLELDHLCRVRNCVNPAHVEAVTRLENVRRSSHIGWASGMGAIHKAKVQCINGHPFDERNTRFGKQASGGIRRQCRACDRLRWRNKNLRAEA